MKRKRLNDNYTIVGLNMQGPLIEMTLMILKGVSGIPLNKEPISESLRDEYRMLERIEPINQKTEEKQLTEDKQLSDGTKVMYIYPPERREPDYAQEFETRPRLTPYDAVLYLTQEQYKALGTPHLLCRLRLGVGVVK